MTTLLQASGVAQQGQGFLNVTVSGNNILFGSEVKDSPLAARFVKSVYAEPYDISVLQISQSIVAPAPAPSPMTRKAPPPAPAKGEEDSRNTAAAPGPGPADSGAPCALGSGAAVAVLMGLILHFVGL
ncbi:fasciclin-like arabinogalactan protein 3 [Pistacia vera]|uniref:fasciclin-like arabinogalactan protein 3 n=1 Tax=Pistacia vera TaxID=55513 RepID=UPI00126321E7|nr:fasciclin-like arabinogalactan protein 3 [Pistacia vera]